MNKKTEKDHRVKSSHFTWKELIITYGILSVLAAGQWLIYAEYMELTVMPAEYIFGMAGYWAIVAGVFALVTYAPHLGRISCNLLHQLHKFETIFTLLLGIRKGSNKLNNISIVLFGLQFSHINAPLPIVVLFLLSTSILFTKNIYLVNSPSPKMSKHQSSILAKQ